MQSTVLQLHLSILCNIGWKSWKLIAWTISPTPSLFVAQRPSTSHRKMGKFWEDYRGGVRNSGVLESVKIEEKLLWTAYRNSPTLFRTVPSPTPYGLLFSKVGVCNPTQLQSLLYQERVKLRTSNLADTFTGTIHYKFWDKWAWACPGTAQIFWVPPIISGTGKAMSFRFCTHIYMIDQNKTPLNFWEK